VKNKDRELKTCIGRRDGDERVEGKKDNNNVGVGVSGEFSAEEVACPAIYCPSLNLLNALFHSNPWLLFALAYTLEETAFP